MIDFRIAETSNALRLAPAALALLAGLSATGQALGEGVDELLVTAQKREQSIQSVPISMTAFTAENLSRMDAWDIQDIALHTPALQYGNFSDLKLAPTSMRGILAGTSSAGQDPSVGYYLDEVYLGPGVGAILDFYDIERVEILRGPQGTLFGRNTIGGVINVTSRRPTDEFSGYVEAEYGNYDHTRVKGTVSGPIAEDVLGASLSGLFYERDGFTENLFLDRDGDDTLRRGAKLSFDFTPTDNVDLFLNLDYLNIHQHSKYFETLRYNPAGVVAIFLPLLGLPVNTDPEDRNVFSDVLPRERLESFGASLRGTFAFDGFDIVSVSGYREHEYFNIGDTDMSPLDIGLDGDPEDVWRFSQELRFVSDEEGALDWLFGLYYFHQDTENLSFIEIGSVLSDLLSGDPSLFDGDIIGSNANMKVDSYAAFANLNYSVTEKFEIGAGLRYTYEKKSIDYSQDDPLGLLGGTIDSLTDSDSWSALTPTVTLSYQWNDDIMSYATVSRGFKSGGFNDGLGDVTGISFDPEFLWNYEVGLKSSWLEDRLVMNAALYYMRWQDIQIQADDPSTPLLFDVITTNAGKAHSQGVEIELVALPIEQFELSTFLALNEAEYDEGNIPATPPAVSPELKNVPRSPDYKFGITGDYTVAIANGLELSLRAEFIRQGRMYIGLDVADPDTKVDPYHLVNARVSLRQPESGWSLAVWGKNLSDETYRTRLFDLFDNPLVGEKFSTLGAPRTYGVEVRMDF